MNIDQLVHICSSDLAMVTKSQCLVSATVFLLENLVAWDLSWCISSSLISIAILYLCSIMIIMCENQG